MASSSSEADVVYIAINYSKGYDFKKQSGSYTMTVEKRKLDKTTIFDTWELGSFTLAGKIATFGVKRGSPFTSSMNDVAGVLLNTLIWGDCVIFDDLDDQHKFDLVCSTIKEILLAQGLDEEMIKY